MNREYHTRMHLFESAFPIPRKGHDVVFVVLLQLLFPQWIEVQKDHVYQVFVCCSYSNMSNSTEKRGKTTNGGKIGTCESDA